MPARRLLMRVPLALVILQVFPAFSGMLPIYDQNARVLQAFDAYISKWMAGTNAQFATTGRLSIDAEKGGKKKDYEALKVVLDSESAGGFEGGHVYHMVGAMRIPGVNLDRVLKTMEDYPRYPQFFEPDVTSSAARLLPDSTDQQRHFQIEMELAQSTIWFDIALRGIYDARYYRLDNKRAFTQSRSVSLREYKDAHNRGQGMFPEGRDHGLLWRTCTVWHLRERDGGLDMELNSISLSRPIPLAFSWWANRKAKESIQKMMDRTRAAIVSGKL